MEHLISVSSLEEAMEKISHRQYLAMLEHLHLNWNRPSRSDWYLMRLAREIRMSWMKDPSVAPSTNEFKIAFDLDPPPPNYLSPEEQMAQAEKQSMGVWGGILRTAARVIKGKPNVD